ncbi:uncharacterized protein LOC123259170 isoform X4 [Cotesia glomerata]|uniref:uncharacterized protein LOC123259170 isoform X4 n=1 Tax=Cotesia glomerata TaxID=32391 RepID=UPI001D006CDB|nr:uncharacterized protein LOC123259170 isoform X4 [Cotesia glomerata]
MYGKVKIDLFIATVKNSVEELKEILYQLKFSRWWNIMMSHFIINGSDNGCKHASTALNMIWQMNILNCYYICFDSEGKPFIYTFNPYSSRAPRQWKIVEEISNASYYLAIYNRQYDRDDICKGFNFNLTKYFDKTQINITISSTKLEALHNGKHTTKVLDNFFTVNITNISCANLMSELFYDTMKHPEVLWCTVIYDLWTEAYWMKRISYPTILEGLYILSSNQRYLSPLEKIHTSFEFSLILGTIIISIITYLVLLFTDLNQTCSFATFEIIRLWIGVSLNTRMNSHRIRIFFSSIP